jgi:hypothetical protein
MLVGLVLQLIARKTNFAAPAPCTPLSGILKFKETFAKKEISDLSVLLKDYLLSLWLLFVIALVFVFLLGLRLGFSLGLTLPMDGLFKE